MPGRPKKEFHEYLTTPTDSHVRHLDYMESPASAFLKYTIEAKSAIDLCVRTFLKKQDRSYAKNSLNSLQHLIVAMLPTIMGHFETYQRYLFAGVFDRSIFLNRFDVDYFFKKLKDTEGNLTIDLVRISAYRRTGASSIGILLADSLKGWHNPNKVNDYFKAFGFNYNFFSNNNIDRLSVLWQLRHSIVHTGGTLTLSDAQKVKTLANHGDYQIAFENNFIFEIARKLHPIIKEVTEKIGESFKGKMLQNLEQSTRNDIDKFFEVKSSVSIWLK